MKYFKNTGKVCHNNNTCICCALSACKKDAEFFDIDDPQGIDSKIWSEEGAVDLFLNRTYGLVMPQWPTAGGIHNTSDELNNVIHSIFIWHIKRKLRYRYRYR